jgi:seryl-tRNA synthetase
MSLYGQSWLRAEQQRGDALKRQRDEILSQALSMSTHDKYILALRKELEWHKEKAKNWENAANESEQDIIDILKAANVSTIPELLKILEKK